MPEDTPQPSPLDLHLASQYPAAIRQSQPADSPVVGSPAICSPIACFNRSAQELATLLHRAGLSPLPERRLLSIRGEDQQRWLNGMVTNTIQDLAPGHSNYNFALNAQGRILGDLTAYRLPDRILLSTDAAQVHRLVEHLDHFIIMDDVELTTLPDRTALGVVGPQAASLLERAGIPTPVEDQSFLDAADLAPHPVLVAREYSPSEYGQAIPRFTLWVAASDAPALWDRFIAAGLSPVGTEATEALRILDGIAQYGVDFNDQHLPQEVDAVRPLHFRKGCYLGQEIVERIRSRAHVNRQLRVVELEGSRPSPLPVSVHAEQADQTTGIGEVTSLSALPTQNGHRLVGLALLRKEPVERNQPLGYADGRLKVLDPGSLMELRSEILASS